jgi:hypothetical protein
MTVSDLIAILQTIDGSQPIHHVDDGCMVYWPRVCVEDDGVFIEPGHDTNHEADLSVTYRTTGTPE